MWERGFGPCQGAPPAWVCAFPASPRLCCPLHAEQGGFWWHHKLLVTPVVSLSCWWSPASLSPGLPLSPPLCLATRAPSGADSRHSPAGRSRCCPALGSPPERGGCSRSHTEQGCREGGSQMGSLKSARLSPSLTGALGLPWLRMIQVGGRQGQPCRVLETMPNGCPVPPPCGVAGCCPPLLPAMALSGAARGRSRWQRQRGGRGGCGGAS